MRQLWGGGYNIPTPNNRVAQPLSPVCDWRSLSAILVAPTSPKQEIGMSSTSMAKFVEAPPIGTILFYKGQPFELTRVEDYTRQDGSPSNLLVWKADCPECGVEFETKSGRLVNLSSRRCPEHRQAGKRVRRKKIPADLA